MNVYDFDKTIFDGDTEDYFFAYLFKVRRLPFYKLNYEWHELLCLERCAGIRPPAKLLAGGRITGF